MSSSMCTSAPSPTVAVAGDDGSVFGRLSLLDRFLPLWIALVAALGLGLGQLAAVRQAIDATTIHGTNLLVAAGLLVMMYPPLAKVRWNLIHRVLADWRLLLLTTIQNWVIGPVFMYLLAELFFQADPGFLAGLTLIGCARCIAMVVVWNALAGGDEEYCAAIVAINSVLTIALYSPYVGALVKALPPVMGLPGSEVSVSIGEVAKNVVIYMGIPFVLGIATWYTLGRWKGEVWYSRFTDRLDVGTVWALLFTILVLFASQSERMISNLGKVLFATVPLFIYLVVMFVGTFITSNWLGGTYQQCTALAFTAASNNFELAMAVSIATFGLQSDFALMCVVAALIEVPTMLGLVYLALWFRTKFQFAKGQEQVIIASSPVQLEYCSVQDHAKDPVV